MEHKKFQSIIRRVVLLPMSVMAAIVCVTIISCAIGFFNMRQQMVERSLSSLQVSQNQLENLLGQIDHAFLEYWNSDESYAYLKTFSRKTPRERYLTYEAETFNWMNNLVSAHQEVQGIYIYYENMGNDLFRGISNPAMHAYLRQQRESAHARYSHWELVDVDGRQYLLNLKNYRQFYGGVWIPVDTLTESLHLAEESSLGTTYLMDSGRNNSLQEEELKSSLHEPGPWKQQLMAQGKVLYNYQAQRAQDDITLGILIPQTTLVTAIPLLNKILFLLALLSVLSVPAITLWLRRKVAVPMLSIDHAMQLIGEGHMDYRITLPEKKTYDEFDRLMARVNQTVDELNELEFTLYKRTIWEQQTKLRYISQQIRPHFILNALNLIYTCEEHEFPLIKKMVLYLTEYFRYIVNLKVDFVELRQELHHVENYLNIQKERYLDRFDFFVEWEAAVEEQAVPPLMIQTFVENCIKYGMRGDGRTFVYVLASQAEGRLKLMIADTGNGFPQDVIEKVCAFQELRRYQEGMGVGIENAIERLSILYEDKAQVRLRNALSGGAVVELYLPIE